MKPRPLNVLTVASLVACVAVTVTYLRSRITTDTVGLRLSDETYCQLESAHERYYLILIDTPPGGRPVLGVGRRDYHRGYHYDPIGYDYGVVPLYYADDGRGPTIVPGQRFRRYLVYQWVPWTLFALLPLGRLASYGVRRYRSRRRDPGRCARCGYDLTGNVSGVCPECGTPRSSMSDDGTRSSGLAAGRAESRRCG